MSSLPLPAVSSSLPTPLGFLAGALFDIDGTLADTDAFHREVFRELLAPLGINCDRAYFEEHISGRSNALIVAELMPNLSVEEGAEWSARKESLFRERAEASLKPLAGLVELLEILRARGVRLAAVTNAPRLNVEMMLRVLGLSDAFHTVIIGGEDGVRNAKPHPDPYLVAMSRLGLSLCADRCVVFEDSPTGVESASKAQVGMVVGLRTSQTSHRLRLAGAHFTAKDFQQFVEDYESFEENVKTRSENNNKKKNEGNTSTSTSVIAAPVPVVAAAAAAASSAVAPADGSLIIALSTHVLNTSNGLPAANMLVSFQALSSSSSSSASATSSPSSIASSEAVWSTLASCHTNSDGRISSFPPMVLAAGETSADFRLVFEAAEYFQQLDATSGPAFFPQITLQWNVDAERDRNRAKLHVPLLLSPYGYSTYRGS